MCKLDPKCKPIETSISRTKIKEPIRCAVLRLQNQNGRRSSISTTPTPTKAFISSSESCTFFLGGVSGVVYLRQINLLDFTE